MTLKHERVAACRRCAAEHPGQVPTPLAVLSDHTPPYEGTPLLYRAVRVWGRKPERIWASGNDGPVHTADMPGGVWRWRRLVGYGAGHDAEPLSPDPSARVLLRCRRCGLKIGPISAGRVAELFAQGRADGNVLLLPVPPRD